MSFDLEFLQLVDSWQEQAWDTITQKNELGRKLKNKISESNLKPSLINCNTVCFRRIELNKKNLWSLGEKLELSESISSWTTEFDFAKEFNGEPSKSEPSIILRRKPMTNEVIINLIELYNDDEFIKAIITHSASVGIGIKGVNDKEKEVVLEVSKVPLEQIHGIGGYIGSLEQLEETLKENEFSHLNITGECLKNEMLKLGLKPGGVNWLTGESAVAVLKKTFEKGKILGLNYFY